MSDYIIHNIIFDVNNVFDYDGAEEPDKRIYEYPNYYLGKVLGKRGHELALYRKRRGNIEEHVPNCILRNEGGIALIRIHNKENQTRYDLPENSEDDVKDCVGVNQDSYPFAYVVVDYRDDKCQIAIERTSNWDSKTDTIRNCLQYYFDKDLSLRNLGIKVEVKEKTIATKFAEFIDGRVMDEGDIIESFTFEYPNLKRQTTSRIPEDLNEPIKGLSYFLETYNALSGVITSKMGQDVDRDKLKQLSTVVTMCSDNAFDLSVKFRDYGNYKCNESEIAKYEMNDIVISHFKDFITPEIMDANHDLETWLNDVFDKIKKIDEERNHGIPTKPKK